MANTFTAVPVPTTVGTGTTVDLGTAAQPQTVLLDYGGVPTPGSGVFQLQGSMDGAAWAPLVTYADQASGALDVVAPNGPANLALVRYVRCSRSAITASEPDDPAMWISAAQTSGSGVVSVNVAAPIVNTGSSTAPVIGLPNPLPVSDGGTGAATFPVYSLLTGGGTGPLGSVAVGGPTALLHGASGGAPLFSALTTADLPNGGVAGTKLGGIGAGPNAAFRVAANVQGASGAGVCTATGLKAGDFVLLVVFAKVPGATAGTQAGVTAFSPTIVVDNQLQQTAAVDLSACFFDVLVIAKS